MFQTAPDQKLLQLLEKADRDLAELVHAQPCPHCGGKLNWANYPRNPRGVDKQAIRFSLCCSQDGCRRRFPGKQFGFYDGQLIHAEDEPERLFARLENRQEFKITNESPEKSKPLMAL